MAEQLKTRPEAWKFTEAQVAEALRASAGIISLAAQKLGVQRNTVYGYIERSPDLKALLHTIKEETIDLAESQLLLKLKEGNMTALIFYLKCQAKRRGWVERVETTGAGGGPVLTKNVTNLSDAELEAIIRATDEGDGDG